MADLATDVLVVGSGAGGAITAAELARAGRTVTVVEEGPWVDADAVEPFSLEEMVAKYRHHGLAAALGNPAIAYAEGRCVGGSTEINSGLYHRLPDHLAAEWRTAYAIDEFSPEACWAATPTGSRATCPWLRCPAPRPRRRPPWSGRHQAGLAQRRVRPGVQLRREGRGTKQTMSRTMLPRALAAGAASSPTAGCCDCCARATGSWAPAAAAPDPGGGVERMTITADHVLVCGGAIHSPALLQRSGIWRNVGNGLKMHPTIKIAGPLRPPGRPRRRPHPPRHRVLALRGHRGLGQPQGTCGHGAGRHRRALRRGAGRLGEHLGLLRGDPQRGQRPGVAALRGVRSPLVTYSLTEADVSRLARGLVHLGELLLAAGATELYPSVTAGTVVRRVDELGGWWDQVTRARANLMTVHLTSSVRMGENRARTGADSFGRVWGYGQPVGQRRLAPPRRSRRQPPGGDHGHRDPQLRPLPGR